MSKFKYQLALVDYLNHSGYRQGYDITDYILNHPNTTHYTNSDDEAIYFSRREISIEFPIKYSTLFSEVVIAKCIKLPNRLVKNNRIIMFVESLSGFMTDNPDVNISITTLDVCNGISYLRIIDISEKVKIEENIEERINMFENYIIEDIELAIHSGDEIEINGSKIVVSANDVRITSNNKFKLTNTTDFSNNLKKKFKNVPIKQLTKSERNFLQNSGLVSRITLAASNSIDDLLF